MNVIKKHYIERMLGKIDKRKYSRDFRVVQKVNVQPNSKGVFSTSLYGNDKDRDLYKKYILPVFTIKIYLLVS